MSFKHVASNTLHCMRVGLATLALFQFTMGAGTRQRSPTPPPQDEPTMTTRPHTRSST